MATSRAAGLVERVLGHDNNTITEQDISNPAVDRRRFAHPTEKMRALVWKGKKSVEVVEVPRPCLVEDRDVIVKVTGSTICGSDLHLYHGTIMELQKGDILGHEFCGVVEELGPGVRSLKKGDRVVASFQIACGECSYCQQKLSSMCERTNSNTIGNAMLGARTAGIFGYSHFVGGFAGGQAEYVRVPIADVNLLKLPESVPDERGLFLSDVLATSYHAVVDTGVKQGDVVAIWGAGPIGQMCVDFALLQGASRVIIIDSNWRLDFVKANFPQVETIDYSRLERGETVSTRLRNMVPGGADVALECVGGEYAKGWIHKVETALGMETDTSEIINEMIKSVKNFGRCGITGVYTGFTNHFNIGAVMERGIRLIGNGQAPVQKYWQKLLKMIEDGSIEPLKMVTHRVRLEDMEQVYHVFDKREDGMQKVFVQTRFSFPPTPGSPHLRMF